MGKAGRPWQLNSNRRPPCQYTHKRECSVWIKCKLTGKHRYKKVFNLECFARYTYLIYNAQLTPPRQIKAFGMFCENPNGKFPCGKCRACKLRKANEKMIISIFAAAEFKKNGQFLTLTYNDEHLPNGLKHSDFSDFMKRLRRNTGVDGLKMFMAGEYGEESGREHFHVLFYNHKFPVEDIEKAWRDPITREPIGFVSDGTCTPEAMKYVSGYINKKGYDPGTGKRPPYGRSSCLLPDNLTGVEIVNMCKTGKIQYNGRKFSVPANWRRRYHDIWKYFEEERFENTEPPKQDLTPYQVSAMMDMRDRYLAFKRQKRKKHKRLV